jgi:hypothetical protein
VLDLFPFNVLTCVGFISIQCIIYMLKQKRKMISKVKPHRILSDIQVDKSLAWGYFDGACQDLDSISGI